MKQEIICPDCQGKGRIPLPDHLKETLLRFPITGYRVAAQMQQYFPAITVNGISNRLQDLFNLGLLTRERSGKFWRYSRAKQPKSKRP